MSNLKEKCSAMRAMIEDWQSSGKSKEEYCLEKGIMRPNFIIDILAPMEKKILLWDLSR